MCGIAGVMNRRESLSPPELDQLAVMAGALSHRGPDEFGVYRDGHAGLAHARLSIIDLATGQQPLSNERGTLWITFNGEIFNYLELRSELITRGHQFKTRSDTEVIVHAYEEWGADAFRRLNGQWAVGLWDAERGELILARDPFGVRPLYVAEHGGRLSFASEVKALFAGDPALPRRLDANGLDQLFTFWSPVAPQTVFEGIEEVEPGTVRIYSASQVSHRRSYDPAFPADEASQFQGTLDDAVEEVRAALAEATQPAHAARGRAGRQLSVGGARQLAHRGTGPSRQGLELLDVLAALRGRGVRRDRLPADDGRAPGERPPRGAGVPRRHRPRVPGRDSPHRAAGPEDGAGAALPALEAGARRRHQGGAHRRGRGRDVRRLRPVPRGQGPAVLGGAADVRAAAAPAGAALSLSRTLAGGATRGVAAVLRPRPRSLARRRLRPRPPLEQHQRVEAAVLGRPARARR